MEGENKAPYLPHEEPKPTCEKPFPEEPELEEINVDRLTPDQKAILELRMIGKADALEGIEARTLISEINTRALNDNISPEAAAKKILKEEQEKLDFNKI